MLPALKGELAHLVTYDHARAVYHEGDPGRGLRVCCEHGTIEPDSRNVLRELADTLDLLPG